MRVIKPTIELLAGIPSVVYGFIGVMVLAPFIRAHRWAAPGFHCWPASVILGIMILPTIISISIDAILRVPNSFREGSLALGATRWQTVHMVRCKAARSGIIASIILGMGRAIGETMAVIMVAGNAVKIPHSALDSVRTLTANIALEMGYATGEHRQALFATGVVLFVVIMILNSLATVVMKTEGGTPNENPAAITQRHRRRRSRAAQHCSRWRSLSLSSGLFLRRVSRSSVSDFLFERSAGHGSSRRHLSRRDRHDHSPAPGHRDRCPSRRRHRGLSDGIHAREPRHQVIRFGTDCLAGIPSIIFGLFGFIFFVTMLGMGWSLLSGGLTLAIMILPTIIRTSEEAIKAVPNAYREVSFSLGATRWQTVLQGCAARTPCPAS